MEASRQLEVPEVTREELDAYYAALPREWGYSSQCKMTLLGEIRGKRVLDIDCRRGKGIIKLSEYVGARGRAVGIDPSPEWIEIARSYMDDAWRRNGLVENNMDYLVGYAEDLASAGLGDGAFDLVFANSSLNVACAPLRAFAEAFRVLRPGGLLIYDGVVASTERDPQVVEEARRIGNAIQAAPSRETFESWARAVGFDAPDYYEESPVDAATGYVDGYEVPVAPSDERVTFVKTTAHLHKPRW